MDEMTPKKISPDHVEVIGANGEVVKEAEDGSTKAQQGNPFGQIHVMKAGPWALLFLPILIPIVILGFFLMLILALFFGRGMFKVFKGQIR